MRLVRQKNGDLLLRIKFNDIPMAHRIIKLFIDAYVDLGVEFGDDGEAIYLMPEQLTKEEKTMLKLNAQLIKSINMAIKKQKGRSRGLSQKIKSLIMSINNG